MNNLRVSYEVMVSRLVFLLIMQLYNYTSTGELFIRVKLMSLTRINPSLVKTAQALELEDITSHHTEFIILNSV